MMKTRLLYAIILILLAGNAGLLVRRMSPPAAIPAQPREPAGDGERVLTIDSLVLSRWSDGTRVRPAFAKPTFLFFFSRANCASCVEQVVDYLSRHAGMRAETYIISTDIRDPAEREAYDARFLRSPPFFALESVRFPRSFETGLPLLLVADNRRQILFVRQVLPTDDVNGAYLFWKRMDFLHYLLTL